MFFLFFLSYVFCCLFLIVFGTSERFSFNSPSPKFFSLIAVINFELNTVLLKSGKSSSLSNSISFSESSSGVTVSDCFAPKNLLVSCVFFLLGNYYLFYSLISFMISLLASPIRYSHRVIWCVASNSSAQRKSCFSCFLVFHSVSLFVLFLISGPMTMLYFFVY